MYVERIKIHNLRTITTAEIDLCVPTPGVKVPEGAPLPNVTLLLGTNGVGKTTVLRAIAMAALAPLLPRSSGFVPKSMVRRVGTGSEASASVEGSLRFSKQDGLSRSVQSKLVLVPNAHSFQDRMKDVKEPTWAKALWDDKSPALFVVGYGASRRVDAAGAFGAQMQEKERNLRFHRVAGLFEESVVLRPLSSWLPHWNNPGRRKQLLTMLAKILPGVDLIDEQTRGDYLFRVGPSRLPFDALSDGLRAFVGWVVDLLYHVSQHTPSGLRLFETEGLVLVDEVDLHLHPAWQRTVISRVAREMPNLQFVFTSHSPMLVGALHRENVRVLRTEKDETVVEPAAIEVHGLSADQILTSEYFGLDTAREPTFSGELEKVAHEARGGNAQSAQHLLRMLTLGSAASSKEPPPPSAAKRARKKAVKKAIKKLTKKPAPRSAKRKAVS